MISNENIYEIRHDDVFFQYQQFDCCFKSLLRLRTKKTSRRRLSSRLRGGLWLDCFVTKTSQQVASYRKFWIQMDIYELIYS